MSALRIRLSSSEATSTPASVEVSASIVSFLLRMHITYRNEFENAFSVGSAFVPLRRPSTDQVVLSCACSRMRPSNLILRKNRFRDFILFGVTCFWVRVTSHCVLWHENGSSVDLTQPMHGRLLVHFHIT